MFLHFEVHHQVIGMMEKNEKLCPKRLAEKNNYSIPASFLGLTTVYMMNSLMPGGMKMDFFTCLKPWSIPWRVPYFTKILLDG